jgi:hypothetical protein
MRCEREIKGLEKEAERLKKREERERETWRNKQRGPGPL